MSEEIIPSVTTKSGDTGYGLPRSGKKLLKDDVIFDLIGTLDELNSNIGLSICEADPILKKQFTKIQIMLFEVSGFVAMNKPFSEKSKSYTQKLEKWAYNLEKPLPPLDSFILPGGHVTGVRIHVTRTVCRRCERSAVTFIHNSTEISQDDSKLLIQFLNRLSDYLFCAARYQNFTQNVPETKWLP